MRLTASSVRLDEREDLMMKSFRLNRENAMAFGVCAGLADYTGWNVGLIRIGLVVVTVLGAFPWTLIAYAVTAWLAPQARRLDGPTTTAFGSQRAPERERGLAEVDHYISNPNSRLEREIEELR
jgi:phage shock protein C